MPPEEVKSLGRWHGMSGKGFAVVETDDAKALYAWVVEWSEFLLIETTPVVECATISAGACAQFPAYRQRPGSPVSAPFP